MSKKKASNQNLSGLEQNHHLTELNQCISNLKSANKLIKEKDLNQKEKDKQLKIAKNELEKINKIQKIYEKGLRQMMFIISHKIRQPITKIMGLSLLIEDQADDPEELHQIIGFIKNSTLLLDEFTRELTLFVHNQEQIKKDFE